MNENYNDPHHQKTTCTFLYLQKEKIAKRFYMQKARHFPKSKTISDTFCIYRTQDTVHYKLFHEYFEVGIYITL